MTKQDMRVVVDELRLHKTYPEVDDTPLEGLALRDFPYGKHVRKECVVKFLNWQCLRLDGTIDEEELTQDMFLLKKKRVIMV